MIYIVKNCHDCPLRNDGLEGSECNHPENNLTQYDTTQYGEENLPDKCPLRQDKFIIELPIT